MKKTSLVILAAALVVPAVSAGAAPDGRRDPFIRSLVRIKVAVRRTKKKGRERRVERVKIRLEDAAMDTWVTTDDAENIRGWLTVLVEEMRNVKNNHDPRRTLDRILADLRALDSAVFLLDRDIHSALSRAPRDKRLAHPAKWLHGTLKKAQGEDKVLLEQASAVKKDLNRAGWGREAAEIVSRMKRIVHRVSKALAGVENLLIVLGESPVKK